MLPVYPAPEGSDTPIYKGAGCQVDSEERGLEKDLPVMRDIGTDA